MYGTSTKKEPATHFCARRSAVSEKRLRPVNRTMTTTAAAPSTADPNAHVTTPMEHAACPATSPTMPPAIIHSRLSHDSQRAWRAARSQAASRSTGALGADGAGGAIGKVG